MRATSKLVGTLVVLVLLASCGSTDDPDAEPDVQGGVPADPTGWLEIVAWVVAADIIEEREGRPGSELELRLANTELLHTTPTHPHHSRLDFTEIGSDWANLNVHDSGRSYLGERVLLALLGTGTRAEQLAGEQENGALVLAVVMILDEDGNLLEAVSRNTELYRELLALYGPPGLDAVISLVDDGRTLAIWSANRVDPDDPDNPDFDPGPLPPRPATPGPLGEWRRANGWESDPDAPSPEQQQFEAWLASDPATRLLPDIDDGELPLDELAAALGTDTLVDWRVYLLHIDALERDYPWVGLRLVDVGMFGLLNTAGHRVLDFSTLGPPDAAAELLAWREPDSQAVDLTRPDLVVALPGWRPPDVVLIDLRDSLERPAIRTTDEDDGYRTFFEAFEATR